MLKNQKKEDLKEKVAITSDHAGFKLKEVIKRNLEDLGYGVLDLGTGSEEAVDYPDYGKAIATKILSGEINKGIAICGTGIGISISANRFKGVRAALCNNINMAEQARKHNNANILAIGARNIDYDLAGKCVDAFLKTDFEGNRHTKRVEKIESESVIHKDDELDIVLQKELYRQQNTIELIASENFTSEAVMKYQGSVLTNKYAEGYPGKRYYGGCEFVDEAENLARERLKKLFNAKYTNVQPHSGSQANMAVFLTFLNPGDTIMGLDLAHGGHLTHGSPVNFSGQLYKSVSYGVEKETGLVNFNKVLEIAKEAKPKMIICGGSAYPRFVEFEKYKEIAKEVNAYLMADIAHPSGLIAAGCHPSPLSYCDVITSTTHKTLRGPRGGIIMMGEDFENKWGKVAPKSGRVKMVSELLDASVMPGVQGGPLMHIIAAKAIAFREALNPNFKQYANSIASTLHNLGINLNFAPVLDLDYGEKTNIGKSGRSISQDPKFIIEHAKIFIEEHQSKKIITCGKHFPGLGSASGDTHDGFTNISKTWITFFIPNNRVIKITSKY